MGLKFWNCIDAPKIISWTEGIFISMGILKIKPKNCQKIIFLNVYRQNFSCLLQPWKKKWHSKSSQKKINNRAKIFLTPVWIISNSLLRFQLSWLCRWRQSYRIENWILMPQFRLISPVSSIKVMRVVKTSRKQIFSKSIFCQLWQDCKVFKAFVDAYNCRRLLILQDLIQWSFNPL